MSSSTALYAFSRYRLVSSSACCNESACFGAGTTLRNNMVGSSLAITLNLACGEKTSVRSPLSCRCGLRAVVCITPIPFLSSCEGSGCGGHSSFNDNVYIKRKQEPLTLNTWRSLYSSAGTQEEPYFFFDFSEWL